MKIKLLRFCLFLFILILLPKLKGQIAHKYLLDRGYRFPLESTLLELDSVDEIRNSYKNVNDSLFLENTIYKYERLAFLPDNPMPDFDYVSFYEEIMEIKILDLNINTQKEYSYGQDNILSIWLSIKWEAAGRLLKYYNNTGQFEKGFNVIKIREDIMMHGDYYGIYIGDDLSFNVIIGLQNIEIFAEMYQFNLWNYFIDANIEYFNKRTMPFLKLVKDKLTVEERQKLLEDMAASIKCNDNNLICTMNFMGYQFYAFKNKTIDGQSIGTKEHQEKLLKEYFFNTEFYKQLKK